MMRKKGDLLLAGHVIDGWDTTPIAVHLEAKTTSKAPQRFERTQNRGEVVRDTLDVQGGLTRTLWRERPGSFHVFLYWPLVDATSHN